MRALVVLAVSCFAVTGTVAIPSLAFAQTAAGQETSVKAATLLSLTVPSEVIFGHAAEAADEGFRSGFMRNPQAQAAVQKDPSFLDPNTAAYGSELRVTLKAYLPRLERFLAQPFAAGLSTNDFDAAVEFYSGPIGTKLVAATPTLALGGNLRQVLNESEMLRFAAFVSSPAGRKIEALKADQSRLIAETFSQAMAEAQPRAEQAAMVVGRAYLESRR